MNVCFVGNSQIAAIKLGWESLGFDRATFLAAPSKFPHELYVDGDELRAPDDLAVQFERFCGISAVKISEFDLFVLVGLNYSLSRSADLFISFRPVSSLAEIQGGVTPVSRRCYLQTVESRMKRSTAIRLAHKLRAATDAKIVILPEPAPTETIKEEKSERGTIWRLVSEGGGEKFYSLFRASSERLTSDRLQFCFQPQSTLVDGAFTARNFGTGRYTLSGELRPKGIVDHSHMNRKYGEIAADALQAFIA